MRSSALRRTLPLIIAAIAASIAAACNRGTLRIHYLPGFVAGTEHLLHPVSIAVVPATGSLAGGRFKVGAIYNADDSAARELYVSDLGSITTDAVVQGLDGAGLKPFALTSAPADGALPPDAALMLGVDIQDAAVNKRFGTEQTVHGQYFSMKAQVTLRFTLSTRANPHLFSTVTTGTEEEPPAPVGGEVFFPLETEPAESLSVALSRAVGALILQPDFQRIVGSQTPSTPHSPG
ncbi:MAG: hypothetical protein ACLQDV_00280 [Candidatus Binataceae bacterium]